MQHHSLLHECMVLGWLQVPLLIVLGIIAEVVLALGHTTKLLEAVVFKQVKSLNYHVKTLFFRHLQPANPVQIHPGHSFPARAVSKHPSFVNNKATISHRLRVSYITTSHSAAVTRLCCVCDLMRRGW
jgi:hypothetical protein